MNAKYTVPRNSNFLREIKLRVAKDPVTLRDKETAKRRGWWKAEKGKP